MTIGVTNNLQLKKPVRSLKQNRQKVAFTSQKEAKVLKGLLKFADAKHSDSAVHVLISTLGCMIFRPIIIMADKKTEIKDKIYSAGWQFGMALFSLPVILWGDTPSHNLAAKMSQGNLKTNIGNNLAKMVNASNKDEIIRHLDIIDINKNELFDKAIRLNKNEKQVIFDNFKNGKELFEEAGNISEETKKVIEKNAKKLKTKIANTTVEEVQEIIKKGSISKLNSKIGAKGAFAEALSLDRDLLKDVFKNQIEGETKSYLKFSKEELEQTYKAYTGKKIPIYSTIWNKNETETLYFKAFSRIKEWTEKGIKPQKGDVPKELLEKIKNTDFNFIFEENFKKNAKKLSVELFGKELESFSSDSLKKLSDKVEGAQKEFYNLSNMKNRELFEKVVKTKDQSDKLKLISKHTDEIKELYSKVFKNQFTGITVEKMASRLEHCIATEKAISVSFLDNSKAFIKRYAFNSGLEENAKKRINNVFTKEIPKVVGLTKAYKLVNVLVACTVVMALVTRYMKDMINVIGKAVTGKDVNISGEILTQEQKDKKKRDDKRLGLTAVAIAALALINRKKMDSGKGLVSHAFGKVKKALGFKKLGKMIKSLKKPNSLKQGKNSVLLSEQLGFQESQKWLGRNILANLITRVGFNLPTGQYYNTIREFFGEGLGFIIITNIAKSKVIKKGVEIVAPKLGRSPRDKSVEFLGNQFVLNWVVVCILMELINTTISSNVYKMLKGKKADSIKPEDKHLKNINTLFVRNLINKDQEMQKLYANVLSNNQLK